MADTNPYPFEPGELPLLPGSPHTPPHPARRRIAYCAAALVTGLASTFPNALVTGNIPNLAGELGVYAVQLSWLPAVYVAFSATANLSLVKARAQFGIAQVTHAVVISYLLAGLVQFVWPSFAAAVLVRAVSGVTAGALISITVFYLLQILPPKVRPLAIIPGIGLTQLGPALARTVPVDLLAADHWRGLHLIEIAVALAVFAVTEGVPLPPTQRNKSFEPLDLATIALVIPGLLLICGVLSEGRLLWWTNASWLGWALAAAVPLLAAAFLIEHHRARPLLQTRWIGTRDIIRFALVALLVRIALAEQTYNAVGLLTLGGLTNDQLRWLFLIVAGAMVIGIAVAVLTLTEEHLPYQILTAALVIAFAAWLDSHATNMTRPPELFLSQALIGFGTTLFIGPSLVSGFVRLFARGGDHFVTLVVVFSTTQNVGGLAGAALLGSWQTIAARAHLAALSEHLTGFDPQVAARIQGGGASLGGAIADPLLRSAAGGGLLVQATTAEANVLAFNDTFRFVAALALLTAGYQAYVILTNAIRGKRAAALEVAA